MTEDARQGVYAKRSLSNAELAEARVLADRCTRHDIIDLRLNWNALRSRSSEAPEAFLYYQDGALVGFLTLDGLGAEETEASGMVHPQHRRKGVFTALVAAACAVCRQNGTRSLVFVCDRRSDPAKAFLAAAGAEYDFSEQQMKLETLDKTVAHDRLLDFQKATIEDAAVIAQIVADNSGMDATFFRQIVARGIQNGSRQFYIAKVSGETIGTINIDVVDGDAYIYGFVIRPEYRGRSYGRQMLARTIEAVVAARPQPVYLEVETNNTTALALYNSFGFVITQTYDYYCLDMNS